MLPTTIALAALMACVSLLQPCVHGSPIPAPMWQSPIAVGEHSWQSPSSSPLKPSDRLNKAMTPIKAAGPRFGENTPIARAKSAPNSPTGNPRNVQASSQLDDHPDTRSWPTSPMKDSKQLTDQDLMNSQDWFSALKITGPATPSLTTSQDGCE